MYYLLFTSYFILPFNDHFKHDIRVEKRVQFS